MPGAATVDIDPNGGSCGTTMLGTTSRMDSGGMIGMAPVCGSNDDSIARLSRLLTCEVLSRSDWTGKSKITLPQTLGHRTSLPFRGSSGYAMGNCLPQDVVCFYLPIHKASNSFSYMPHGKTLAIVFLEPKWVQTHLYNTHWLRHLIQHNMSIRQHSPARTLGATIN